MPIPVEELESKGTDVKSVQNRKAQDAVLAHLKKHSKQAFTQGELGKELNMRPQQVRQCCMALRKKGLTVRKAVPVEGKKGVEDRVFWAVAPKR